MLKFKYFYISNLFCLEYIEVIPTDFIAELYSSVKFTWIAIGTWK